MTRKINALRNIKWPAQRNPTAAGRSKQTSLDVEWAHAIAPKAKILLVEAKTPSGPNLLDAIDYATAKKASSQSR